MLSDSTNQVRVHRVERAAGLDENDLMTFMGLTFIYIYYIFRGKVPVSSDIYLEPSFRLALSPVAEINTKSSN